MIEKWRTRAAFMLAGRWQWLVWDHDHGNKHAAIVERAQALNAQAWDFGNADHGPRSRVNF